MAQVIHLHIGLPKTGTSFVQETLRANRRLLRETEHIRVPFHTHRRLYGVALMAGRGFDPAATPEWAQLHWQDFVDRVRRWDGDLVASHEALSMLGTGRVGMLVDRITELGKTVRVVMTVRDLARQIPSFWQQQVKAGGTESFPDFLDRIRADRSGRFWQQCDAARVAESWSQHVGADNVTVVTLPTRSTPSDTLWDRFAPAIGLDPVAVVPPEVPRVNASLGVVDIELVRRMNLIVSERDELSLDATPHHHGRRAAIGRRVTSGGDRSEAPTYPAALQPWVIEESTRITEGLAALGCPVVGSLDELMPGSEPPPGRDPGTVTDDEIAQRAPEILHDVWLSYEETVLRLHDRLRAAQPGVDLGSPEEEWDN